MKALSFTKPYFLALGLAALLLGFAPVGAHAQLRYDAPPPLEPHLVPTKKIMVSYLTAEQAAEKNVVFSASPRLATSLPVWLEYLKSQESYTQLRLAAQTKLIGYPIQPSRAATTERIQAGLLSQELALIRQQFVVVNTLTVMVRQPNVQNKIREQIGTLVSLQKKLAELAKQELDSETYLAGVYNIFPSTREVEASLIANLKAKFGLQQYMITVYMVP